MKRARIYQLGTYRPITREDKELIGAYPSYALLRIRRPDGRARLIRVPSDQWDRVMNRANNEFGSRGVDLGGPEQQGHSEPN